MASLFRKIFPKRFSPYWQKIKENEKLDKDIKYITDLFINSESYKYVSNMWHIINISHYKKILEKGIENYGSGIAQQYFTFTNYEEDYLKKLLNNPEVKKINKNNCNFKVHDGFTLDQSTNYNYLCKLLYEYFKSNNYFEFLKILNDKTYIGFNDPYITLDSINITTDKIVSLLDFEKINNFKEIENNNTILELGAGSGRLSECILSLRNNINYTICDIPPSIYVSYKRLKLAFPQKKISLLININDIDQLTKQIKNNDISFIFPHQLKFIKSNFYNMALAVDCLHEMDNRIIKYTLDKLSSIKNLDIKYLDKITSQNFNRLFFNES